MPFLLTSTVGQFTANTRAKATEVNNKFNSLWSAIGVGSGTPYIGSALFSRSESILNDYTITGNQCLTAFYFTFGVVGWTSTLDFATYTARGCFFGEFGLASLAVMHVISGAEVVVI